MFSLLKPSELSLRGQRLTQKERAEIRPVARLKGNKCVIRNLYSKNGANSRDNTTTKSNTKNKTVYFYPSFLIEKYKINELPSYSKHFFGDLTLPRGTMDQVPFGKERDCLYICGPSGSGKSYKVTEYCNWYNKCKIPGVINANKQVFLISPKTDDDNINSIKNLEQFDLDEENFVDEDTKLDVSDLADSLVIFDDIEAISNIKIREGVRDLRDNILLLGRSKKVYCIVTNHLVQDYKNTRVPLLECQFYTYFPGSGANRGNINYFKNYCGFGSQMIHKLLNVRSRSATIHLHNPQYLLTKDRLVLLSYLENE